MVATVLGWIVDGAIVLVFALVVGYIVWRFLSFVADLFLLVHDEVEKRKGK
jgi:hypothetical protein